MVLSLGDVATLLKATGEIDSSRDNRIFVNYDSYSRHSSTPGVYHLSLRIENDIDPPLEKNIEIRVIEQSAKLIVVGEPNEAPLSFWQASGKDVLVYSWSGVTSLSIALWLLIRKKKRLL
jgi:LPXTG-motif cell wall-anchored protein